MLRKEKHREAVVALGAALLQKHLLVSKMQLKTTAHQHPPEAAGSGFQAHPGGRLCEAVSDITLLLEDGAFLTTSVLIQILYINK